MRVGVFTFIYHEMFLNEILILANYLEEIVVLKILIITIENMYDFILIKMTELIKKLNNNFYLHNNA